MATLDQDCGNGHLQDFSTNCICDKDYAGSDRMDNCFVLDENKKIAYLVTIDSCTAPCNWTSGADPDTYDHCVRPMSEVCG